MTTAPRLDLPAPGRSRFGIAWRHERRLLRADRIDLLLLGILVLAIGYAFVNGSGWVARQDALLSAARAEETARVQEQRDNLAAMTDGRYVPASSFRNPASPLWVGNRHAATYAAMPPSGLAATAVGQSDLNPPYVQVNADSRETFALNEEIDNPSNLLIGHFDLAFFIVYLLPLIVIALCYNLLSAEREQGTLGLAASNPVPLAVLLGAKLAVRAVLVLLPVLGLSLVGLAVIGAELGDAEVQGRFGLWAVLVIGYGGFWLALCAAVNVLGRSSAHNALLLVSAWIVLTLVLPTLLSVGVNLALPVPSRSAMINQLREVRTEVGQRYEANAARYALEHESPAGILGAKDYEAARKRLVTQQEASARVAGILGEYEARLQQQRAVVGTLRFLSPAILMQDGLNEVAGSGELRYAAFNAQVDAFYAEWQQFFRPKVLDNVALTLADYDRFPRFAWAEPALAPLCRQALLDLFALLVVALALGAFSAKRIARYPVLAAETERS